VKSPYITEKSTYLKEKSPYIKEKKPLPKKEKIKKINADRKHTYFFLLWPYSDLNCGK
jgi:ribosomal protein L23